jgi:hypothetical protein
MTLHNVVSRLNRDYDLLNPWWSLAPALLGTTSPVHIGIGVAELQGAVEEAADIYRGILDLFFRISRNTSEQ